MNVFISVAISGSVMILFTALFRAIFAKRLHKRTFPVIWGIITLRLLIPVPIPISAPALFNGTQEITDKVTESFPQVIMPPEPPVSAVTGIPAESHYVPQDPAEIGSGMSDVSAALPVDPSGSVSLITVLTVIWAAGITLLALYFVITYVRCMKWFSESLPVSSHEYIDKWLSEHKLLCKKITVRSFDRIVSPLTYGILSPVILLPSNYEQLGEDELDIILTHEYIHIKRFDAVFKTVLTAVLCLYWFDPFVWLMYILANRDIELACDDAVLRQFGASGRKLYANTLVRIEELKNGSAPTTTN